MNLNDVRYVLDEELPKLKAVSDVLWLMRATAENERTDVKLRQLVNCLCSINDTAFECVKDIDKLLKDINSAVSQEMVQ